MSSMPLATFVWSTLSSVLRRLVDSLCRRLGLCGRPRRLLGGPLLCRWLARPPLRRHRDHLFISSRRERRRCRALCRARRLLSLGRSNVWRRFCIVPSQRERAHQQRAHACRSAYADHPVRGGRLERPPDAHTAAPGQEQLAQTYLIRPRLSGREAPAPAKRALYGDDILWYGKHF